MYWSFIKTMNIQREYSVFSGAVAIVKCDPNYTQKQKDSLISNSVLCLNVVILFIE